MKYHNEIIQTLQLLKGTIHLASNEVYLSIYEAILTGLDFIEWMEWRTGRLGQMAYP